jgi:CHAT domain-containing protein/predicted negative regulator of RcsB-dependent stress response
MLGKESKLEHLPLCGGCSCCFRFSAVVPVHLITFRRGVVMLMQKRFFTMGWLPNILLIGLAFLLVTGSGARAQFVLQHAPEITGGAAQGDKDAPMLELGKPIERELIGGQSHQYLIGLAQNQFLRLIVEQKGIDVAVLLFDPEGKKIEEVDRPNGSEGPEPVSVIANTSGSYRLEVRSLDKAAKPGRYEAKITELRAANEQDKKRSAAQQAFAEGDRLSAQRTAASFRKAIEKYTEALSRWREVGDQGEQGNTLNNLAVAHYSLGEIKKALDYLNQALPLARIMGDQKGEGETLTNIGYMHDSLGEKQKALEYYNQSLPILRTTGNRMGEAATLNNIGMVYDSLGEKQKALDLYNQVLPLARAIGNRDGEASTLSNIGKVYRDKGENRKALEYFNQTLQVQRAIGNRRGEAITLNNLGAALNEMGETQMALDHYAKAIPLSRAAGDRHTESGALINLGSVYSDLGEKQRSLDYYNQALAISRDIGDRRGEALAQNNLGEVYADLGEKKKALDYYDQSLAISRAVGDRALQANALNNLGGVFFDLAEMQKALDYYNQALALLRAVGDRREEANTLNNIGDIHYKLGDKQKALEYFNQALTLRRAVEDRNREAITLLSIARVERDSGNLSEARKQIEAALKLIELQRAQLRKRELRASYFASAQKYYEFYIDLLMRLRRAHPTGGFEAAALRASEQARARSLLEALIEAQADIRQGVDPALLERERDLQQLLNAKTERQMRLLAGSHIEEQTVALAKEIQGLVAEYEEVEAQVRATSPHYAALTQPQALSLEEIQEKLLDKDTLLLEYALGDERSYLWAVSQTAIASFELPNRSEIETAAHRFYQMLTAPNQQNRAAAQGRDLRVVKAPPQDSALTQAAAALSGMLLAPVASQLEGKRLLIVGDGALHYVPFAALPTPPSQGRSTHKDERLIDRPPLILKHEIVSLPSASTLAVLRRETAGRKLATKTVAVVADPVFDKDDERIRAGRTGNEVKEPVARPAEERALKIKIRKAASDTGMAVSDKSVEDADWKIPRLPGTRQEAQRIVALAPKELQMTALDFAASRATATSEQLGQYRFVHFATHGFLNSARPELSGLVLSTIDEQGAPQQGFLLTEEVYNLKLPVELVALSACQTGLGKEVRGEGLVGFTRGFMYAGAPRVVVSLWSVDDDATASLMVNFYRGILKEGRRPAAALKAAQVETLKQKRWRSPYYWAAFILQGEWK